MSLEIESIKRRKQAIRSLRQINMPPGSQMTVIENRTKEGSNQATGMEENTTNKTLGEKMMIENQKRPEENLVIPVECVKRQHMETYLSAWISRSTFQASQGDQLVHLKKLPKMLRNSFQ